MTAESTAQQSGFGLGDESSVWFNLTPLLKDPDNPMRLLMQMAERYGPVIPVNMANQRIVLVTEPELFKHVLVTKVDNYVKYFDGLKPIFGKSMITHDGALWQKIRMPQQPAFHPDAFAEYIPYFIEAIKSKMAHWAEFARTGETFEMVEQTWTLAADMICKALFDRDMPFNPHFVFKCVKTYTDVSNHKDIRLKRQADALFEVGDEDTAKAVEAWWSVPPALFAADPREEREKTLLKMIQNAMADPSIPEFDEQQAIDEIKQYLWAGTETTALTFAWALYLTSKNPEAAERIRREGETVYGDREPTAADYSALQYTRAVIQETMRLYPPVWSLIRVATEPDVIGGKEIKPGDRIVLFSYGAHHNPRFWKDPEEFIPERWMDKTQKQVKYSYVPFGAGKRSCIGGAMSQVENTLALSILLRRFRPEYVGLEPPGLNATVTLTPRGGLLFRVQELS
ncbi:cytochrome P450 [Hyphomicrobium nitrativorans NL23]|uniref:Cytochrome P450 n=1 Tax=Hyphomicrobium nitrativorans NL23 TaxID=1029756 RepID=V5SC62_9HYPH|nr:cytochrome P450 [Hyphomicrobium nitrativorans]AHB48118.1 cytochrome P450 [Hyphomicrobium nitrativorans NL23]